MVAYSYLKRLNATGYTLRHCPHLQHSSMNSEKVGLHYYLLPLVRVISWQ